MVSTPRFSGIIEHPAFKLVNKTTKLKIILCSSAEMRLSLWMKMILFYFCLFGLYVGISREAVKIKSVKKGVKRWKIVERRIMGDFAEFRKEMPGEPTTTLVASLQRLFIGNWIRDSKLSIFCRTAKFSVNANAALLWRFQVTEWIEKLFYFRSAWLLFLHLCPWTLFICLFSSIWHEK